MYRYPMGKEKILTMSYDDGTNYDRKLVEIFNNYSIRGSFHLNSGFFGREGYLEASEIKALFRGHEVSAHTLTHPFLTRIPTETTIDQVMQDRRNLEGLVGYPVRGMSYPYGDYNSSILELLPKLGIEYSRTVHSTYSFNFPDNFIKWDPTCHHNEALMERAKEFVGSNYSSIMYVWGHSYEFARDNNWEIIEEFCKYMSNKDNIWYATNIEIVDYMNAVNSLRFSADSSIAYNPSSISVWISVGDNCIEIPSGQYVKLN